MHTRSHSGQSCHRLTLASCRNQYRLLVRIILQLINFNQSAVRNIDVTQLTCRSDDIDHASSFYYDLSSVFVGRGNNLLHTVYIGGKGCHNNPVVFMLCKNCVKGFSHRPLRSCKARTDCIGTVA